MSTFGYTTAGGGTVLGPPTGDYSYCCLFTVPLDCSSITSLTVYCIDNTSSKSLKGCVWDSVGNLLTNGVGNAIAFPGSAGWATSSFSTPPTVTPGSQYNIGLVWTALGSQQSIYEDAGTINQTYGGTNTYSAPTSFSFTSPVSDKLSIYATYTPKNLGNTMFNHLIVDGNVMSRSEVAN